MNKAEIQNLVKELSAYDSNYDNYIMTEQDISILADELLAKINYTHCCKSDSEQLKALEDLKDFAYDNCQPHNSDRLSEIMERL